MAVDKWFCLWTKFLCSMLLHHKFCFVTAHTLTCWYLCLTKIRNLHEINILLWVAHLMYLIFPRHMHKLGPRHLNSNFCRICTDLLPLIPPPMYYFQGDCTAELPFLSECSETSSVKKTNAWCYNLLRGTLGCNQIMIAHRKYALAQIGLWLAWLPSLVFRISMTTNFLTEWVNLQKPTEATADVVLNSKWS